MARHLKPSQAGTKGVQRIIKKRVKDAVRILTDGDQALEEKSVHKIRTDFKKTRASLRLLKECIGKKSYRKENACFRDAGKPFTQLRDAKVLSDTLLKLSAHYRNKIDNRILKQLDSAIQNQYRRVRRELSSDTKTQARILKTLKSSKKRIDDWSIQSHGWSKLGVGISRAIKSSRVAFKAAQQQPTPGHLHEWRKQVKYLRYQVEIIEPALPRKLKGFAQELHKLTNCLGDDHDLYMFATKLNENPHWLSDKASRNMLLSLIEKRQQELRHEAFALGARLFSESPSQVAKSLKNYWKVWKSEGSHPTS